MTTKNPILKSKKANNTRLTAIDTRSSIFFIRELVLKTKKYQKEQKLEVFVNCTKKLN